MASAEDLNYTIEQCHNKKKREAIHLSLAPRSEAVGIALFVETSNMKPHADMYYVNKTYP